MERWMHRKVAEDIKPDSEKSTLEIGAGTLNHLVYESISKYDIVEPFKELYIDSPELKKINTFYCDIAEIENKKYFKYRILELYNKLENYLCPLLSFRI